MAVISSKRIWSGRDGNFGIDGILRYSQGFQVVTNNKDDDQLTAAAGPLISLGSAFPTDASSFCTTIVPTQDSTSPFVWIVVFRYTNERTWATNPLLDPIEPEWSEQQFSKAVIHDINGDLIVNSAGDAYDEPYEIDDSRLVVSMEVNLASAPAWILTHRNTVNDSDIVIDGRDIKADKAKVVGVRIGKPRRRNAIEFRKVTLGIACRDEDETDWHLHALDRGFRELHPDDPTLRIQITDGNHVPVDNPALLDGAGVALFNPGPANAVSRKHEVYPRKDFTTLPGVTAAP